MIEQETYDLIRQHVPICCVDLIVKIEGKVVLCLRRNEPAKGQWWLPGGRVLKGEELKDAAVRKAKEELGLDVVVTSFVGTYETMFPAIHTINTVFVVEPWPLEQSIQLEDQHSKYRLVEGEVRGLDDYVTVALWDSGFLKR